MAHSPRGRRACTDVARTQATNEVRLLMQLRHPHIIEYLGHQHRRGLMRIFMEYAENGDLEKLIQQRWNSHRQLLPDDVRSCVECTWLRLIRLDRTLRAGLPRHCWLCSTCTTWESFIAVRVVDQSATVPCTHPGMQTSKRATFSLTGIATSRYE